MQGGDQKILGLEGLRALLAWWVTLGHVTHTVSSTNLYNGLAVDVFIILSGFVIFRLIDTRQEVYGVYILRRAFRIFPVYLAVLIVSAALLPLMAEAAANAPFDTIRNAERARSAAIAMDNLPLHFWLHVPLLHGLVPNGIVPGVAYTIVGPAWSVALEWQFYLIAPMVYAAITGRRHLLLAAFVCAILLLAPHFNNNAFLGNKALLFGIGIATHFHGRSGQTGWLAAAVLCGAGSIILDGPGQITVLAIWALSLSGAVRAMLARPLLVYLGTRSYSVYLIHMVPLFIASYVLNHLGAGGLNYAVWLMIATVAGTLLLSELTYRFIERPGIAAGSVAARAIAGMSGRRAHA